MRLPGGKVRRGPCRCAPRPKGHTATVTFQSTGSSEGLRPSPPQTVPRTVCPCGNRRELPDVRSGAGRAAARHVPIGHTATVTF